MDEKKITGKMNIVLCAISVIVLVILLFPLFWTLITSFKTEKEIFQIPPTWYPHVLNTKSYAAQIETGDFNMFKSFFNSFMISSGAMLIAVVSKKQGQERIKEFFSNEERLDRIARMGAEKARKSASKTLNEVRKIIGFRQY